MEQNIVQLIEDEKERKRIRFEMVRLVKEILLENSRTKPVESREVTEKQITDYADNLLEYVNKNPNP